MNIMHLYYQCKLSKTNHDLFKRSFQQTEELKLKNKSTFTQLTHHMYTQKHINLNIIYS